MPLKDMIQNQITLADWTAINSALSAIETALSGKTVNLTPEERQKYGSINEQNKLFVNKINDQKQSHPQHLTPKVDWGEFENDLEARTKFEQVISRLLTITEQMGDTKVLHDNDNYQQALSQYAYISYLASENEPGTTVLKEELQQFFNRTGVTTPTP